MNAAEVMDIILMIVFMMERMVDIHPIQEVRGHVSLLESGGLDL